MRTGAGLMLLLFVVSTAAGCYEANEPGDRPGILVSPTSGLITSESGAQATFSVVLNTQPAADVVIDLSSSNTNEGTVLPVQLTFTDANWNQPQTVTVTGANDTPAVVDGDAAYAIVTAAAVSADGTYNGMDAADVSVTNADNDVAGITVTPTSVETSEQDPTSATFTVQLNNQPSGDVTVRLTVPSGYEDEGLISTGAGVPAATLDLLFTAAAWGAQTVTVAGQQETTQDGDQTYTIDIVVFSSADPNYVSVNPDDVTVTNRDNDTAGITVTPTSGLVTNESGGQATFTIVLTSAPTDNVTIGLSSDNTDEGTVSTASVTFDNTNWFTAQTVTVTGQDDGINVDGPVAYSIVTAADTTTSDTNYLNLNPPDVSVTNNDNDGGQVWVKNAGPVLPLGAAGAWDETYVQEPSVIRLSASSYEMWYEGYGKPPDNKNQRVGRALSTDGIAWSRNPAGPVLSETGVPGDFDKAGVEDPCVVFDGTTYRMWYAGRANATTKDKIGLATSQDGIDWTKYASNPVLSGTPGGWDATGVEAPHVLYDPAAAKYRMWYTGNTGGVRQIGYATSDNGILWDKPTTTSVLAGTAGQFDSNGAMSCCVILDNGTYRMWYTGLGADGIYRIGYATSANGLAWTKDANNPVLVPGAAGSFDVTGVAMPWVIKDGTTLKMWYSGLNGTTYRIGYAEATEP